MARKQENGEMGATWVADAGYDEELVKKVACFHVDAFRFEMGRDFSGQLAEALDMEVVPAIAALPSITPLCMAALLPGAAEAYAVVDAGGKVGARVGSSVLTDVNDRMKSYPRP